MALIPCRECGKEVSDGARFCPHCGAKLIASKWIRNSLIVAIAGIALFVSAGLYVGKKTRTEAEVAVTRLMEEKGYKDVSLSYSKYVTRGHNYYTCGTAYAKDSAGAEANHLFYVTQTGSMREMLGAEIDGNANFSRAYAEICID